jgi:hypothetical protein
MITIASEIASTGSTPYALLGPFDLALYATSKSMRVRNDALRRYDLLDRIDVNLFPIRTQSSDDSFELPSSRFVALVFVKLSDAGQHFADISTYVAGLFDVSNTWPTNSGITPCLSHGHSELAILINADSAEGISQVINALRTVGPPGTVLRTESFLSARLLAPTYRPAALANTTDLASLRPTILINTVPGAEGTALRHFADYGRPNVTEVLGDTDLMLTWENPVTLTEAFTRAINIREDYRLFPLITSSRTLVSIAEPRVETASPELTGPDATEPQPALLRDLLRSHLRRTRTEIANLGIGISMHEPLLDGPVRAIDRLRSSVRDAAGAGSVADICIGVPSALLSYLRNILSDPASSQTWHHDHSQLTLLIHAIGRAISERTTSVEGLLSARQTNTETPATA